MQQHSRGHQRLIRWAAVACWIRSRSSRATTTGVLARLFTTCLCDLPCDCPTGKSPKPVQPSREKYSASRSTPNHSYNSRHPAPARGAYRDRHGRWVRDAVDAAAPGAQEVFAGRALARERRPARRRTALNRGRQSRVVLAPVAGVKPAEVCEPNRASQNRQSAGDGGKRIRLQGEHGISRKTIAQGMPGCSGCTCMLVCAFFCAFCTRDRGCQPAPGIPCALLIEGREQLQNLGRNAPRERGGVSSPPRLWQSPAKAGDPVFQRHQWLDREAAAIRGSPGPKPGDDE